MEYVAAREALYRLPRTYQPPRSAGAGQQAAALDAAAWRLAAPEFKGNRNSEYELMARVADWQAQKLAKTTGEDPLDILLREAGVDRTRMQKISSSATPAAPVPVAATAAAAPQRPASSDQQRQGVEQVSQLQQKLTSGEVTNAYSYLEAATGGRNIPGAEDMTRDNWLQLAELELQEAETKLGQMADLERQYDPDLPANNQAQAKITKLKDYVGKAYEDPSWTLPENLFSDLGLGNE